MVNLKICVQEQLPGEIGERSIVCFGAGRRFPKFLQKYPALKDKIICILDNNPVLSGKSYLGYPIYSVSEFLDRDICDFSLVITALHYGQIFEQINGLILFNSCDCYIDVLNEQAIPEEQPFKLLAGSPKIPRKIHYCWFGDNDIPAHLQKYIDSWKRCCPDYEIILWNEKNYDIAKNRYMQQAWEAKKWAYVSDYARLDIIFSHGGIYLDTDVELLCSLDDLLCYDFFCGFETGNYVNFGLGYGAVKNHYLVKKCLEIYEDIEFIKNGELNLVPCPKYQSAALKSAGFLMNGQYQEINGAAVFPQSVFCPGAYTPHKDLSPHTHSIHHFEASWMQADDEYKKNVCRNLNLFKKRFMQK